MSDQAIEEVIGWRRNPEYDGNGWAWLDDRAIAHDGAEVDDLLAWLKSKLVCMEIEVYPDGYMLSDGWDIWINTIPDYEGIIHHSYSASGQNMRDAFIDLARQVNANPPPPIDIIHIELTPSETSQA